LPVFIVKVTRTSVQPHIDAATAAALLADAVHPLEDGKPTLATSGSGTQPTSGDRLCAPAILPDPQGRRPGGYHLHHVHTRWRLIDVGIPGHYAELRQRLDLYAKHLVEHVDATDIDH
jgi:hypothetical protein